MENVLIAFAAAVGAAIFVYRKTSRRGTGDFIKQIAPAAVAGLLAFMVILTLLATVLDFN